MKIVRESLNEFHQTGDPLGSLGIGPYEELFDQFFSGLGIDKSRYIVKNRKVVFNDGLLIRYKPFYQFPDELDELDIGGDLSFQGCVNLIKLPNKLKIHGYLNLKGCKDLIKLPNDLKNLDIIMVNDTQEQLIEFINQSILAEKLVIE